ncbi:MAG: alpha/beta fold hydrolase [Pseudomonadota bacterium]
MSAPPDRSGTPWPLILHLASGAALLEQGARLAPLADQASFPWKTDIDEEARAAAAAVAASEPRAMATAIRRDATRRLADFCAGLRRYQTSAHLRTLREPPTIWRRGAARLLDYGPEGGAPVFVSPSLINRPHILDLDEGASLLRHLSAAGLRPLLLDWGPPGREERGFTLTDYVEQRLAPAFAFARETAGRPLSVLGYCLGGALASTMALLRPDDVARLALIGAPWDFREMAPMRGALASLGVAPNRTALSALVASLSATYGAVPMPMTQAVFAQLDPGLALRKFRRFAALPENSPEVRRFTLLEDWLNDGPPLSAPAARQALIEWHLDNAPLKGRWRVFGEAMRPAHIRVPTLVAAAKKDRITPPAAALPLAEAIPNALLTQPETGHVGMIAGRDAVNQLWRPLAAFLSG